MRGVCFVHVLFHHVAKRPNGLLAQVLGTPVKFPSDSRAIAIPWHRSSSSQKALWCRGALRVGGVRWAVEVFLGLSLKLLFCNPFLTSPKPDLLQLSLPQPGHQHLLHCALRLGSFGTSWITCTSLIPWATSCSPKTALTKGSKRACLKLLWARIWGILFEWVLTAFSLKAWVPSFRLSHKTRQKHGKTEVSQRHRRVKQPWLKLKHA